MIVSFTGTQDGCSPEQHEALGLATLQWSLIHPDIEVRHGDCLGADAEFHDLVRLVIPSARIIIHPPLDPKKRAWCTGDATLPPKPYLDRNKDIVNAGAILIAVPRGWVEKLRSGTWSTVRYARKIGRPVLIIWPDGSLTKE